MLLWIFCKTRFKVVSMKVGLGQKIMRVMQVAGYAFRVKIFIYPLLQHAMSGSNLMNQKYLTQMNCRICHTFKRGFLWQTQGKAKPSIL